MYQNLLYTVEGGIATLTLNRPDSYNSINDAISYELQDCLKAAAKDPAVRVLILTGAGKAFCSGQDLKEASANPDRSFLDSLTKRYNPIVRLMRTMPKPIIGRINGVAAGAGCSFALACDVIVAQDQTYFTEIFINIGLVPDSGSTFFLPRSVGSLKAFELATMGTKVPATEAVTLGLINKAVPLDMLDATVDGYAQYYASAPTLAIGMIKKMLNVSTSSTLDDMLQMEAYHQEIAGKSADAKEGVASFVEKRKAAYTGQ